MAILNPQEIRWNDPTTREDGSAFGASDFQAFELGVSPDAASEPVVVLALPVALGVELSPIPSQVSDHRHEIQFVALRTLDRLGQFSEWSNRVEVMFSSRPFPPADLSAGS